MSHAILIMGLIIAFGGKLVGIVYISLSEHKSTVPWVVFSLAGYCMVAGSQIGALS